MTLEQISLAEIDPPAHMVRSQIDETGLEELGESIKTVGLLNPIIVKLVGGRFEVVAGHRRLLAAVRVGLVSVPCLIHTEADGSDMAAKIHENLWREDLSPCEEAAFYAELMDQVAGGVDEIVTLCRQSRARVEGRLNLLHGNPQVLSALAEKKISLGVAENLNRCKRTEDAIYYLGWAIAQGATVALVRTWVASANANADLNPPRDPNIPPPPLPEFIAPPEPVCYICGYTDPRHDIEFWYIHRACRQITERQRKEQLEAMYGRNHGGSSQVSPASGPGENEG